MQTESNKTLFLFKAKFSSNMSKKSKLNQLAENDNMRLLDELCVWIEENINTTLGMQELIDKTNLSSTDIQFLVEQWLRTYDANCIELVAYS